MVTLNHIYIYIQNGSNFFYIVKLVISIRLSHSLDGDRCQNKDGCCMSTRNAVCMNETVKGANDFKWIHDCCQEWDWDRVGSSHIPGGPLHMDCWPSKMPGEIDENYINRCTLSKIKNYLKITVFMSKAF